MKRTDLPAALQELLRNVSYVSLATVNDDDTPWCSPVYGVFDDGLRLYWASWTQNKHSQNIDRTQRVFAVVYDTRAPEGQGQGIYFAMHARRVTPGKLRYARAVYATKFGEAGLHEPFTGDCVRRLYVGVPDRIWCNVDRTHRGQFVDDRQSLKC